MTQIIPDPIQKGDDFKSRFKKRAAPLKVAVVHDWIFVRRGGERVLEQILSLVPHADLYCLFGNPERVLQTESRHRIFRSFLAALPWIEKCYKMLLPLLPTATESFDLSSYDLVLSSSSCVAKGAVPSPLATHVCYVHSPMRYAWDQEHRYFTRAPTLLRPLEVLRRLFLSRLRVWDVTATQRCHALLANSAFVARRCFLYYGKKAHVLYPPVNVERFTRAERLFNSPPAASKKVLLFGAWVPYKEMAEAADVCVQQGYSVVCAGQGKSLQQVASRHKNNAQVEIFFNPTETQVENLFARCHILLFPGLEDFGIVPVEAQSAGMWVVAPRQGGTGETVLDGKTGFHFDAGNKDSMVSALKNAMALNTTPEHVAFMRNHARTFSQDTFLNAYSRAVLTALESCEDSP